MTLQTAQRKRVKSTWRSRSWRVCAGYPAVVIVAVFWEDMICRHFKQSWKVESRTACRSHDVPSSLSHGPSAPTLISPCLSVTARPRRCCPALFNTRLPAPTSSIERQLFSLSLLPGPLLPHVDNFKKPARRLCGLDVDSQPCLLFSWTRCKLFRRSWRKMWTWWNYSQSAFSWPRVSWPWGFWGSFWVSSLSSRIRLPRNYRNLCVLSTLRPGAR